MTSIIEGILLAGLAVGIPTLVVVVLRNIDYRIARHQVEVLLFGVVVRRLLYQDISDVKLGLRLPGEIWPNLRLFRGRFLSIRRKRGFGPRYLVLTPRNPAEFHRNLRFNLGWNTQVTGAPQGSDS